MGLGGWLRRLWRAVLPHLMLEVALRVAVGKGRRIKSRESKNKLGQQQELVPSGTDGNLVSDFGGVGSCRDAEGRCS